MSGNDFERHVTEMLRRRAADIEDDPSIGSQPKPLGASAAVRRRRLPLALVASLALVLAVFGVVLANRSTPASETVASGVEPAASQPVATATASADDGEPASSTDGSATPPNSDPCPQDFPVGRDTNGDGVIDTCYADDIAAGQPTTPDAQQTDPCPQDFPEGSDTSGDGVIDTCSPDPSSPQQQEPVEAEEAQAATDSQAQGVQVEDRTWLLPDSPWEVQGFTSQFYGPPGPPAARADFFAATDAGPFDAVVRAYYLPGIDYRRVGNPGGTYRDETLSDGRIVRIRDDTRPVAVTMVFEAPGGAAVAIGYSVSDENVLTIIEGLVIDEGVVSWPGGPLPQDLFPVELTSGTPFIASVNMGRNETQTLQITEFGPVQWPEVLNARVAHPDATLVLDVDLDRAYAYGYDPTSRDDAGAVYSHQGRFYLMRVPRWSPSDPHATVEEVVAILSNMTEVPESDVVDGLGLERRADVYQNWFSTTPLPDDHGLEWMFEGPPVDLAQEAFFAHQVFACAWAGEWVKTGDESALAQLDNQSSWPTAAIIAESRRVEPPAPGGDAPPIADPLTNEPFFYTVEQGDVLSAIAERFNVTIAVILANNPELDLNVILLGTQILIPSAADLVAAPTPLFLPGIDAKALSPVTPEATVADRANRVRQDCGFALADLPAPEAG